MFLENTKKYLCANPEKKPIRKIEANSLVIYPLYNNGVLYGAIQKGIHNFYKREKEKKIFGLAKQILPMYGFWKAKPGK